MKQSTKAHDPESRSNDTEIQDLNAIDTPISIIGLNPFRQSRRYRYRECRVSEGKYC